MIIVLTLMKPENKSCQHKIIHFSVQWEPENSGMGRRLLDSNYDF